MSFDSTGVGAILRFLGSFVSSFSLSVASLLMPATLVRGVSGGVVMGTPVTLPELVAETAGTVPDMRVGLLMTPRGMDDG